MQKTILVMGLSLCMASSVLAGEMQQMGVNTPVYLYGGQNQPSQVGPYQWQNRIDAIKADSQRAIEQNDRLVAEYANLYQKYIELQQTVEANKVRNEQLKTNLKHSPSVPSPGELNNELVLARENLKKTTEEIETLRQFLADWANRRELLELKKADLDLQHQEVAAQIQAQSNDGSSVQELENLKEQLKVITQQERETVVQIMEARKIHREIPEESKRLKGKNAQLKEEIKTLENIKREQVKSNEVLSEQIKNFPEDVEKEYMAKVYEKVDLEVKIEALEKELKGMDKTIAVYAEWQQRKRQLTEKLIALDNEHQMLKQQVDALNKTNRVSRRPPPVRGVVLGK